MVGSLWRFAIAFLRTQNRLVATMPSSCLFHVFLDAIAAEQQTLAHATGERVAGMVVIQVIAADAEQAGGFVNTQPLVVLRRSWRSGEPAHGGGADFLQVAQEARQFIAVEITGQSERRFEFLSHAYFTASFLTFPGARIRFVFDLHADADQATRSALSLASMPL